MLTFTDAGKIADRVATYGFPNDSIIAAQVRTIWNAWPGLAKKYGRYIADDSSSVPFRADLYTMTKIPENRIIAIGKAISELGSEGVLDIKYLDPNSAGTIQSQNATATATTGGGFLDKLLSPITAVENNFSYIKYGAIGIGVIALLWVGLPYLKMGSAGIKAVSEKFKRKQNPEETDEYEEDSEDES